MTETPLFLPATPEKAAETTLSVLSYNVLAQALISRSWFPYCAKKTLKWAHRNSLITSEIKTLDPDIACFQEVDQYPNFYSKRLDHMGFEPVYYAHQSKKHGCCIAFKKEKYSLECFKHLDLDKEASIPCTFSTGNVLLLVALKPKTEDLPPLVVGTCHLFWSPDGGYERLRQSVIATKALHSFSSQFPGSSIILTGDFNLSPNNLPYQAMTHQSISLSQLKDMDDSLKQDLECVNEELTANEDLISTVKTGVTELKLRREVDQKFQNNKFCFLMSSDSETEDLEQKEEARSNDSKDSLVPEEPLSNSEIISPECKTATSSQDSLCPVTEAETEPETELDLAKKHDLKVEPSKKVNKDQIEEGKDKLTTIIDTLESLHDDLKELKDGQGKLISRQKILSNIVPPGDLIDILKQGPKFHSCYSEYTKWDKTYHSEHWSKLHEPCFTNYTKSFKSTLDYIFTMDSASCPEYNSESTDGDSSEKVTKTKKRKFHYIDQILGNKRPKLDESTSDNLGKSFRLTPHQLLALPSKDALGEGFPDEFHPSDHFPIMVRFRVDVSEPPIDQA